MLSHVVRVLAEAEQSYSLSPLNGTLLYRKGFVRHVSCTSAFHREGITLEGMALI